ncbi:MAG: hypothetical protein GDA56_21620 [Hormoscilla sp. GM7CHS1pb]|nr:hypothetical protein [Hormoscilla sp. GM7CHS1pb]
MPHVCLLSTPLDLFERWMNLLQERPVTNGVIFYLLHIAIMLAHQVTRIYTFNVNDFSWCSQIEVIDPSQL